MDFFPLRSEMDLASRVLLGVAVCYSGWADWEMAGWKLLEGTAALQNCSPAALQYTSDAELDSQCSDVNKQLSVET